MALRNLSKPPTRPRLSDSGNEDEMDESTACGEAGFMKFINVVRSRKTEDRNKKGQKNHGRVKKHY
jgi:hypothetical protein